MKAQPRLPDPAVIREDPSLRGAVVPSTVDERAAANDDARNERRRSRENPLWVINIAMAAFFIVTALVIMFT